MKSSKYVWMASGALGSSLLAFGGCSSGGAPDGDDNTDQVQSALNSMRPIKCRINPSDCKHKVRKCVEASCRDEIKALLHTRPFSSAAHQAVSDLQECAQSSCGDVCGGGADAGTGGAPGSGGTDGGTPASGGAVSTGGATATGGAVSGAGGAPAAGGAAQTGGAPADAGPVGTGGAAQDGGKGAGGCGGTAGAPATGGAAAAGAPASGGAPAAGGAPAGGAPAAGGATGGGVDISGTWISHVQTSGTITAPVVGTTAANIDIVLRLVVSQTASAVNGTFQICRLNTVTTPNASSLVVTFTPEVLATLVATVSEPAFDAIVGAAVPLPAVTIRTGIDAAGNPVDADMDGNPGVTIPSNVGGVIQLNAFTGLTIMNGLTATLSDPATITGTASFSSSGTVFGSDNPVLTSGSIDVTPSSMAIPFTATKLAGNVPCSTVLNQF